MTRSAPEKVDLVAVIRMDFRDSATGPDAVAVSMFGSGTLIGIQHDAVQARRAELTMPGSAQRFVDVGRVLVIDDASGFAAHAVAYQHLVLAATISKLICLIVGDPADPADPSVIDLPKSATSPNATVIWVGDTRGVGWRLGMTTTTRLADANGADTIAELASTLTEPTVFDRVFGVICELPGRLAVPALLPTVHWPALELLRLSEERAAAGIPSSAEIADVLTKDIRQLLTDLWSYAPAVARCERLLAEAEESVRRLSRIPGFGGRRAWKAVTQAGRACAELPPSGQLWAGINSPRSTANQFSQPVAVASLWHWVGGLLPLLAVGCGLVGLVPPWWVALAVWAVTLTGAALLRAGLPAEQHGLPHAGPAALTGLAAAIGAAAGALAAVRYHVLTQVGLPDSAAYGIGAGLGAAVLVATAFIWWRRSVRLWKASLPFGQAADLLTAFPHAVADRGVAILADAANAWYRGQRRRLVIWWARARRAMRIRMLGEVAELLGLPKPAPLTPPEVPDDLPPHDDPGVQDLAAKRRSTIASASELLGSNVVDEDFLQLSSPEQLPLLDGSPQAAKLVRYAPANAQELLTDAVGDSVPMADIAWTARGETIGVIRLVPVRPGLVRTGEGAVADELAIALYITGGGEHAAEQLLSWLSANDDLPGRLSPPDPDTGQISVRVADQIALRELVEEIIDSLRGSDETTVITFTSNNGRTTLIAAEVMFAGVPETAVITQRIVRDLWP